LISRCSNSARIVHHSPGLGLFITYSIEEVYKTYLFLTEAISVTSRDTPAALLLHRYTCLYAFGASRSYVKG
jgi:hypothetical protein